MNYQRIYNNIIDNAKHRLYEGYTEKHHIIPRSLGGADTKNNLVNLTAREHFICHWLLTKFTTGNDRAKMIFALRMMKMNNPNQQRYETKITARVYENIKKEYSKVLSKTFKGRKYPGELNGMYGKQHTQESKELMSENRKGKTAGRKNGMYGKQHTQESKELMSEHSKGNTAWNKGQERTVDDRQKMKEGWATKISNGFEPHNKGKVYTDKEKKLCPYCNRLVTPGNYSRWHGNNCKEK